MIKRIFSMILAFVMALGLLPATALASDEGYVYLSVSFDGQYFNDQNGDPIMYVPIPLADVAAVDLADYGLENMLWDGDQDGAPDTTALQLIIYAHENLYGGSWADVNFTAAPGSSYFQGGIFGFTENLVYFLNGDFPVDETQTSEFYTVGATSDRISLKAGDFLDIASFSCYGFLWDADGGFHLFADAEGNYVHNYTAEAREDLPIQLIHSFCDLESGTAWTKAASGYTVYYGAAYGSVDGTAETDGEGCAELTFDAPGTYYIWCDGAQSTDEYGIHMNCDHYYETGENCIVSAPAYATVTVSAPQVTAPEAQDVSAVLNATMAKLAQTVKDPAFGTNAGEWTVFDLARGGYYAQDSAYFAAYYDRIVEMVGQLAAETDLNGALDKSLSTENSRLIVALSAIGKDATAVGTWDLVKAYTANGKRWIAKQGMNGTIWALIALDSNEAYAASTAGIRQECVDELLKWQHDDGGWALKLDPTLSSNVDITGMVLTALYPYRDQEAVAAACEEAFQWLSSVQLDNGGFPYGSNGETSESCAWAIVACCTWGINPDTDSRFVKGENSAVDNLLSYYIEEEAMFAHQGGEANHMATDQACYALIAYDRLLKAQTALFDYSDVTFETVAPSDRMAVSLGLPAEINAGDSFNGTVSISKWDNAAGYKLLDFIVQVPEGVSVTGVTPGSRLAGGEVRWELEEATGKLRVVYFDANQNTALTVSGEEFPAELFTLQFKADLVAGGSTLDFGITGMSAKLTSDSEDEASMTIINTNYAKGSVDVVIGISYSAKCLYTGDGVDLIPETKKAVAVAVTGISGGAGLAYDDGENTVDFRYSAQITDKTGVSTYVALVDEAIPMENFVDEACFTVGDGEAQAISFGDTNGDGVVNAQDALAVVDTWLRKGEAPTDDGILTMNINGDSRINTFDALGIVEAFVNITDFGVVTRAAAVAANP